MNNTCRRNMDTHNRKNTCRHNICYKNRMDNMNNTTDRNSILNRNPPMESKKKNSSTDHSTNDSTCPNYQSNKGNNNSNYKHYRDPDMHIPHNIPSLLPHKEHDTAPRSAERLLCSSLQKPQDRIKAQIPLSAFYLYQT